MRELRVVEAGIVPYAVADGWQRELHALRLAEEVPDVLLLLEHPHVYTLGRRFDRTHLLHDEAALAARGIEVHECDRGGSITYHGPGQIVGYPVMDLRKSGAVEEQPDVVRYVRMLEEALLRAVRAVGVIAGCREGMTGVWVGEAKLASIGVNVSRGVSRHGFALNVSTDLAYFSGMVPCGIPDVRMTSLAEVLRRPVDPGEVGRMVAVQIARIFHRRPVWAAREKLESGLLAGLLPDATMPEEARVIELLPKPDASRPPGRPGRRVSGSRGEGAS